MPISMFSPITGSMPNVSGISRATPIVAVRPGKAPMTVPPNTPTKIAHRHSGLKTARMKPREALIYFFGARIMLMG